MVVVEEKVPGRPSVAGVAIYLRDALAALEAEVDCLRAVQATDALAHTPTHGDDPGHHQLRTSN
jgi:hypothetical protein